MQVIEGTTLPADSRDAINNSGDTLFEWRRPYLWFPDEGDEGTLYIGQMKTHHDDLAKEFDVDSWPEFWGGLQPDGSHESTHVLAESVMEAISKWAGLPYLGNHTFDHKNYDPDSFS